MQKTILLTGSTDGIGLETAKLLVAKGHRILLHGRNKAKLEDTQRLLRELNPDAQLLAYIADLADLDAVSRFAKSVLEETNELDVVINNAGVFKTQNPLTTSGLDIRFVVNTLAPYLLTKILLPGLDGGRVINLSSAAQAPVNIEALLGNVRLDDAQAYAQSKLALTMWSRQLGLSTRSAGPSVVAVNPGSLLATNMVKTGYGIDGHDVSIGANILVEAALADSFVTASGLYYDNDSKRFASPHPDAMDDVKSDQVVEVIENVVATWLS